MIKNGVFKNNVFKNLRGQFELIEKNAAESADTINGVIKYINCRVKSLDRLILIMKGSKDLVNELPRIINMMSDIERILNKIKEISVPLVDIVPAGSLDEISSLIDKRLTFNDR